MGFSGGTARLTTMEPDTQAWWNAALIWVPILAAVVFVAVVWGRRAREGGGLLALITDRGLLIAFFYSGALLAIYLSCLHFFYIRTLGLPPAFRPGEEGVVVALLQGTEDTAVLKDLAEALRQDTSLAVQTADRRLPREQPRRGEAIHRLALAMRARVVVAAGDAVDRPRFLTSVATEGSSATSAREREADTIRQVCGDVRALLEGERGGGTAPAPKRSQKRKGPST